MILIFETYHELIIKLLYNSLRWVKYYINRIHHYSYRADTLGIIYLVILNHEILSSTEGEDNNSLDYNDFHLAQVGH